MRVRYQADADLNHVIVLATRRRAPGIDFRSAAEADLERRSDAEVLSLSALDGRVLVTHDRRTMPTHFAEFITKESSAGVVVVPRRLSVAAIVEDLVVIWAASDPEEGINRIASLPLD